MSREAMKQALEALESYEGFVDDAHIIEGQWHWLDGAKEAITALRQALEQPADEIDWKDQYEKQKRRAEMWVAKYEKDIGPVEKAVPMQQPADEPVAWEGYDLDAMVEAFDRVIEAHFNRKNPFHNPIDADAKMALRVLRGFIPYMKSYTRPLNSVNSVNSIKSSKTLDAQPAAQSVTYQLSPTDIYDFAGWLTTRKGVMTVGSSCEAGPMAEAVGEYLKTFPERFNTRPQPAGPCSTCEALARTVMMDQTGAA